MSYADVATVEASNADQYGEAWRRRQMAAHPGNAPMGSICGMLGGHTNMALVAAGMGVLYFLFFRKKKG